MDDFTDLPYKVEYSKSSRASCRGCKKTIDKECLRLAAMVQSPKFDAKIPMWFHYKCFFAKQRPKTVDDIQHFELLRWEDQEKIQAEIKNVSTTAVPKGKGKKRTKEAGNALKDFRVEYAKSSRAVCRGCELKIMKEEVRIAKKDFTTEVGMKYGGQDMWHHISCFAKLRSELGFYAAGSDLAGFNGLKKEDKEEVKKELPAIKQEDSAPDLKKVKKEDGETAGSSSSNGTKSKEDELREKLAEQAKISYKYYDLLKKIPKATLTELLEYNRQEIPPGTERILNRLSDVMTFGALKPCPKCKGQLVVDKEGYNCTGNLTEWTKCEYKIKEPPRKKFVIPPEIKAEYSELKKYKYEPRIRVFKEVNSTAKVKKEEENKRKIERDCAPLYNMNIVIVGKLSAEKDDLKREISKLGGKLITKIDNQTMVVISNAGEVEKLNSRMKLAKEHEVHVVPETFLAAVKGMKQEKVLDLIKDISICDWGTDPAKRLVKETESTSKSRSIYTSRMPSKVTMKVKGGLAVDPDSGLEDVAHVYVSGDDKYTVVLGKTDIQRGKNSYYKLQLLQSDSGSTFWVFRAWGRTGTTIGGTKLEQMDSLHEAKELFHFHFEEKSGNTWHGRHNFRKVAGAMCIIDVDYADEVDNMPVATTDEPSKLPPPVQTLMKLIFNINDMKRLMLEFDLDIEKMPLGKLSKSQITKAFGVLNELQALITRSVDDLDFVDASNRFYTFIPHSAGVNLEIPVLKTQEQIKQKTEMLENLLELEIAYNLMKSSANANVDSHYEQLNAEIGVLDRESQEFALIKEYVKNTHASTHDSYDLVVTEVFTVKRQGEEKRFRPFRKLHNRKLLWHGSRITNYAGILSQGLRIAPPEAPVTGYMFGKGIYFADMVSKSANYCSTTRANNTGLLLLCDVALGEMVECKDATYIEKLPSGKHSCKGLGMTHPDPSESKTLQDIEVPLGKPKKNNMKSSLLYNEFIVYDIAQVNIKYLVQTEFKYKKF